MANAAIDSDRRFELHFPRSLSIPERMILWIRGRHDARRGKVSIYDGIYLTSPYCETLASTSNLRILAEWQECNGAMLELQPKLATAISARDSFDQQIEMLQSQKEVELAAMAIIRDGDSHVSQRLAEKRQSRRLAEIENKYLALELEVAQQRRAAEAEVEELYAEFLDCRDIAETHERVVRIDFLAHLAAYAHGVARKKNLNPRFINDAALSTEPKDENTRLFARFLSPKPKPSTKTDQQGI